VRYVYANGRVVAQLVFQSGVEEIFWIHENPVTSERMVNAWCGIQVRYRSVDALGNAVETNTYANTCWSTEPDPNQALMQTNWDSIHGDSSDAASGCYIDGIERACTAAARLVNIGAAFVLPQGASASRYQVVSNGKGFGLAILYPFGDGLQAKIVTGDSKLDVELPHKFNLAAGDGLMFVDAVDWSVLQNSLKSCIKELWPWFEMTGFKPTTPVGEGGKADDDTHNGVITIRDTDLGQTFNVVNDPTPPPEIKALLLKEKAGGVTSSLNPFWNYTYPKAIVNPRPADRRYPELFGQASMDYIRVQIHETGASLSAIRDIYHPGPWKPRLDDGNLDPNHPDDGPALEDCVGRTYFQQLGLKPHTD
jgi:hypothetical protein